MVSIMVSVIIHVHHCETIHDKERQCKMCNAGPTSKLCCCFSQWAQYDLVI